MKAIIVNIEILCNQIENFFINNKKVILICFGLCILVNAVDIFTIKFGIDSEHAAILGLNEMFKASGRIGLFLFANIFPMGSYQIISQILGIFFIIIASLIVIKKYNFNDNEKILFTMLFVTYPSIAFMQYFYFQSFYIFFCIFLTVLSYELFQFKNILNKIAGIILLIFSISVFQANIAIFFTVMAIHILFDFFLDKQGSNTFSKNILLIIKYSIYAAVAAVLFLMLQKFILNSIWGGVSDSYHQNMIAYKTKSIIEIIGNVLTTIWRTIIGHHSHWEFSSYKYITITMFIALVSYFIYSRKLKKSLLVLFYTIVFILGVFSLHILLGTRIGSRVDLAVGFYGATIILLLYHVVKYKIIKNIILIIGILSILNHSYYIVKYQTSYYLTYKQDQYISTIILKDLYEACPDIYDKPYKIVTYGKLDDKNVYLLHGQENFGMSQYAFPFEESRSSYILSMLKLASLPSNIELGKTNSELDTVADEMPSYPHKGYIKIVDDTIILKLR